MITKVIASYPCGSKQYFNNNNPKLVGLKLNGVRPHLLQIFTDGLIEEKEIKQLAWYTRLVHVTKGRLTVDGEFLSLLTP